MQLTFARATLKAIYLRLLKMLWIMFCADCVDDCGLASVDVAVDEAVDGLLSRRLTKFRPSIVALMLAERH